MAANEIDGARYTRVAMWLHWLIALAVFYNLASGLLRPVLPRGFFVWHISSGITILALTAVRVLWRLTHRPPPLLPMRKAEATAAHIIHFLLYAAMVLLPLTGWAMISANPPIGSPGAAYARHQAIANAAAQGQLAPPPRKATMVWNLIKLPMIGPINEIGRAPSALAKQNKLHERLERLHMLGGWTMLLLLLIHVGGAMKHQFADREPELQRMGFRRPARRFIRQEQK
ncbi:cytochrome b [Sphingomonas sp. AP4-R1]|uniref:cytochrome b n=1 Tax=Sphingomonas sp. AP4-R1 TaxID=2735134 RepID=UPI0014939EBB|nr:cytochrome b [Sphingomonas sp. AP4-R1]QJU60111.1 cytochrome b [Sphingomonas sp. AP4-R1]